MEIQILICIRNVFTVLLCQIHLTLLLYHQHARGVLIICGPRGRWCNGVSPASHLKPAPALFVHCWLFLFWNLSLFCLCFISSLVDVCHLIASPSFNNKNLV